MIAFRDATARRLGLDLIVHVNEEGLRRGVNPIASGSALHTDIMKTQSLKQALDKHGFDAAVGGARRDEEKSRAKERVFSFRSAGHGWDPRRQRPELWNLYNTRISPSESIRVFPLSNWTELDVWQYIRCESIPVVPLYFAKERPVVARGGTLIMVDDERLPLERGEEPQLRRVRFRTLGCYPLTGAIEFGRGDPRRHHRRAGKRPHFGAAGPADRQRRIRLHGKEEAAGLFLMPMAAERPRETEGSKDLLRFITCGSVDDGKSTLIGRLLHDSKLILEDQLSSLIKDSARQGDAQEIDFSLLVDGLEAEREQGITIDVAYRFFATARRSFIVADTPGHEHYTRNMATGASTAQLAIILIDARKGVLIQTRRHSLICSLLGIRHVIVAVNKMDLVDFRQDTFDAIAADYAAFADKMNFASITSIPISARFGDNIIARPPTCLGIRARRCWSILRRSSRSPTARTRARSAFRCNGSIGCPNSAAMPERSLPGG